MRQFLKLSTAGLILALGLGFSGMASAQTFSAPVFEYASEAQSLQAANDHKKAIKRLKKGLKLDGLTAFETSTMYQMLGASYYARGENEKTIEAFEYAVAAGGLSPKDKMDLRANIAQLNIKAQNYALGAQQFETYFREGGVQKPTYVKMLVQAYVRSKNKAAAVPWADAMSRQGMIKTKNDHELVIFLFDSPEKRASQMQVAKSLLQGWPNDPDVLARIARLNVKAKMDGVPQLIVPGS